MQHGDWKMTKTVLEKAMGFLPQTYTKVTLPISQNEIALSIVLAGIGMSFLMKFYLQAKVSPLRIVLGETLHKRTDRRGFE